MGMFIYQGNGINELFKVRVTYHDGNFAFGVTKRGFNEHGLGADITMWLTHDEFIFFPDNRMYKNRYGSQKLCIPHDRAISFEVKQSSSSPSIGQVMRGRPQNEFEIEYIGADDKYCQIRFNMRKYQLSPYGNQEECERLVRVMKAEGIFDKFIKSESSPQSSSPQPQPDILAKVQQLADLHRQGILTDEEFEAKKTELLARL